ncbi:MAG: hypothetical protein Q7V58_08535 [Actinomycetota bacterium]|nr:hypothetical protein [Actinomycetota bacterium]
MPPATRAARLAAAGIVSLLSLGLAVPAASADTTPTPGTSPVAASASPSPSASPTTSPSASPSATPATTPSATPSALPSPPGTDTTTTLPPDRIGSTVADALVDEDAAIGRPPELAGALGIGIDRFIPYQNTATAVGSNGIATTTLPVPQGLVPGVVTGTLVSIADSPGYVRIRVGTNWIFMDAEVGGDFSIPIPQDAVVDSTITIEVRNTLFDDLGECAGDYTTTETIQDIVIGFIGRETPPDTIAGFFSPPVQRVTIVIPDAVDLASAEAAMATAGAVARRYDRNVPIFTITEAQAKADPDLLRDDDGPNRIVRMQPTSADVVDVSVSNPGVPTLTISGPVAALANAGAALAAPELGLAAVPQATALTQERIDSTQETLTFAQLGSEKPRLAGLGRLDSTLGVPQDRFGGPAASFTIHVEGAFTPIPANAQATASLLWNDQLVESQLLVEGYLYAADVTVSGPLVQRDNTLTIRVDASPPGGDCGSADPPFQMDINGFTSTISATAGQTLAEGFTRFPQAFGSDLHVAFGSAPLEPRRVQDACSLVISLQRASNRQLEITAESFATFMAAPYPGMVVGATPEDADALQAPLRFEPFRALQTGSSDFSVTVDGPFAALEAIEYSGRNILMLGSRAPVTQSEPLMSELANEAENGEFGWNGLRDNLMVAQPGAEILFLSSQTLAPQASVVEDSRAIPYWLVGVVGAILLILLVRWVFVRRRKKRLAGRMSALADTGGDLDDDNDLP